VLGKIIKQGKVRARGDGARQLTRRRRNKGKAGTSLRRGKVSMGNGLFIWTGATEEWNAPFRQMIAFFRVFPIGQGRNSPQFSSLEPLVDLANGLEASFDQFLAKWKWFLPDVGFFVEIDGSQETIASVS